MKITFYQQSVAETETKRTEKNHMSGGAENVGVIYGACFAPGSRDGIGISDRMGEKGKSLIELQQEAAHTDVAIQQDYMTLMSNTMSEEDYARLQEEGFDFGSMEPEEAVTIVDKIKAELVRAGKQVAGYTDDLDMDTLVAALGSQTLAQSVADSFRAADVPLTEENLRAVALAWDMASQLKPMEEGSLSYLIDNEMEGEIWNLYLAQNSGADKKTAQSPAFFAEDVRGYYTRNAGREQSKELSAQIDRVLEQSGREADAANRERANWLLEKGLPLTEENLNRLEELEKITLPAGEELFAQSAAAAVAAGKNPVHGSMAEEGETLYQRAVRAEAYYHSDGAWEKVKDDITARRQLEEIRLRMTAEVNVKLLKSGFSIDTAPMETLVEALRLAEQELANQYFPGEAEAVSKYQSYQAANAVAAELPALPAQVLGVFAEGQSTATLENFHREGKALQDTYEKAGKSYETLMTAPRGDMGDSIRKAFANVDEILRDLGLEPTEENRRGIRILGYNRMELTLENLESVQAADRQVRRVVERLTPAATLKMIRDRINPLEKSFEELETYFDSLPREYREESESYSRFLYGLEQNKSITEEERQSYIGIYRLMRQIEKTDGAAVGALVNTQAEVHFANLLAAIRSGKFRSFDVKVADGLGTLSEVVRKGETISEQISGAFAGEVKAFLTEVSQYDGTDREYFRAQLEQYRAAVSQAGGEAAEMLGRGEISANAENLLAAEALLQGEENLFAGRQRREAERSGEASGETPGEKSLELWEKLDEKVAFTEEYSELAKTALEETEEMTFAQAETSLDVRGMQLAHKQLTIMSSMARQEEYFIPMYVGDVITRVHLTFDRDGQEKGSVRVETGLSQGERVRAVLYMENGVLEGIFSGQSDGEVMKLGLIADTFKREASAIWQVGSVSVVGAAADLGRAKNGNTGNEAVENRELYRMAKVFLQAVQETMSDAAAAAE